MPFTSTLGSALDFEGTRIGIEGTPGSPGSVSTIANVEDFNAPLKQVIVVVTNVGDAWQRRRPTLNDMGNINFKVFYQPAEPTHDNVSGGLLYMQINKVLANWVTVFADAAMSSWAFPAYTTDFGLTAKVGDVYHANCQLANDGAPTIS